MNEYQENPEASSNSNPNFWPYTLLAVSFIIIMIWQIVLAANAHSMIQAQASNLNRVSTVAQQTKDSLEKIVVDLLELSKSDNDAKAIVDKYQIRQTAPTK